MNGRNVKRLLVFFTMLALFVLTACGKGVSPKADTGSDSGSVEEKLETIKLALSPFQDVYSIYVGIEKGFFKEQGIHLDVKQTDWAGGNDLLVGGQVDLATASDSDVVLQNANGADTTLVFPVFYYAGAALMYDDKKYKDWKTYDEFLKETGDKKKAMRLRLNR